MFTVVDEARGSLIGDRITLADTSLSRMVGLLGKRSVDAGGGLWINPSSGVHTLFMRMPIDVIGLDKDLRVIRLWNDLVPWRITAISLRMKSVIELPAGRIRDCGVIEGDLLRIDENSSSQ